jgi:hypothetical protein
LSLIRCGGPSATRTRTAAKRALSFPFVPVTRSRSDESPAVGIPNLVVGKKSVVLRYEVETNSGPIDSFELAERCMAAWSKFLGFDVRKSFGIDFRLYG